MDTGRTCCLVVVRQRQEVWQRDSQRSVKRKRDCHGEGGERRRGKEAEVSVKHRRRWTRRSRTVTTPLHVQLSTIAWPELLHSGHCLILHVRAPTRSSLAPAKSRACPSSLLLILCPLSPSCQQSRTLAVKRASVPCTEYSALSITPRPLPFTRSSESAHPLPPALTLTSCQWQATRLTHPTQQGQTDKSHTQTSKASFSESSL